MVKSTVHASHVDFPRIHPFVATRSDFTPLIDINYRENLGLFVVICGHMREFAGLAAREGLGDLAFDIFFAIFDRAKDVVKLASGAPRKNELRRLRR